VPLTVTHPEVARFFLTVEEAAALVLRATSIGENRDLFVLQVGEEVRILELANRLLVLANKPDLPILVTGLRPGEKLHEEFWYADEELLPTPFPYISRTVAMPIDGASLDFKLGNLRQSMYAISDDGLRARIRELVPHYRYGYVSHGGRGGLL
jgi:FlaA1/EpsC-like NDP-sugar epimerase